MRIIENKSYNQSELLYSDISEGNCKIPFHCVISTVYGLELASLCEPINFLLFGLCSNNP